MGGTIEMDRMKLFPDVPENHWAYEYIGRLAAAGIVEGYPDGMFNGNRMMSRYEFAAMLYRALEKGVKLDHKLPLIIEVPDRHGTGRKPDFITSYVNEAIGLKL